MLHSGDRELKMHPLKLGQRRRQSPGRTTGLSSSWRNQLRAPRTGEQEVAGSTVSSGVPAFAVSRTPFWDSPSPSYYRCAVLMLPWELWPMGCKWWWYALRLYKKPLLLFLIQDDLVLFTKGNKQQQTCVKSNNLRGLHLLHRESPSVVVHTCGASYSRSQERRARDPWPF